MLTLVLAIPVACAVPYAVVPWRRALGWLGTASAASVLLLGVAVSMRVVNRQAMTGAAGTLRADALSSFMVVVIGVIALLATWQSVRYLEHEIAEGRSTKRHASAYALLVQGFLAEVGDGKKVILAFLYQLSHCVDLGTLEAVARPLG